MCGLSVVRKFPGNAIQAFLIQSSAIYAICGQYLTVGLHKVAVKDLPSTILKSGFRIIFDYIISISCY